MLRFLGRNNFYLKVHFHLKTGVCKQEMGAELEYKLKYLKAFTGPHIWENLIQVSAKG